MAAYLVHSFLGPMWYFGLFVDWRRESEGSLASDPPVFLRLSRPGSQVAGLLPGPI